MTKKGLGIAVLLSLGIAVLSGCGAKSSSQAVERAMPAAAETAAEEKAGEAAEEKAGEAAAEEKAGEAAAEEKTGETKGGNTLASRLAGVYSCEQDGEYHTLELFEFAGNLLGQGGIAEKPEGNDPAEPYSFWALEVVPADSPTPSGRWRWFLRTRRHCSAHREIPLKRGSFSIPSCPIWTDTGGRRRRPQSV